MRLKRRDYVLIWAGGAAASMALERALSSVLTPVEAPRDFADALERSLKETMQRRTASAWRPIGIAGGVAAVIAGLTAFVLWLTRRREAITPA